MSMRSWSIPAGRLFGIEIRIHLTFFFLLIFVLTAGSATQDTTAAFRALGLVGIIFGSVILHELGHALVARRAGVPAKGIILLPIGGITILDESQAIPESDTTWKRDIRIAVAGPLVNLFIAGAAALVLIAVLPGFSLAAKPLVHPSYLLRSLVWSNVYLGLFNLLPAYPMDGGRVLRALFSRRMDPIRATQRAVRIGHVFAVLFMMLGMLISNRAETRADGLWLLMIGFFLFVGAQLEERSAVFHSVLQSVRLEEVMLTDFATLSPADTLEDALDKAVHTLQDDFPVVRGSDMVGVISKQKILDALRADGNGYVQSAMNKIFEVAAKQESLASAFRKLAARNLSIIPVVDEQRLVGIVTLQNLMHSMALLAESRKLRREGLDA
ncbi:MAG: site-2 protease family protein [Acidobacteriales bacterium]|nr:site-2 protease family protein [Candidatus Koribacter versatilis]MBI3644941.1 site-2 protease family protein [Terriglobales bacterium]